MVINTMGWVDGLGYDLLLHSIRTLKADSVIVVGQDRLHSQLRNELRSGASTFDFESTHVSSTLQKDIRGFVASFESVRNRQYDAMNKFAPVQLNW